MTVIGQPSYEILLRGLPPVALLVGAKSVGKWTTAEHIVKRLEFDETNVLRVKKISMDRAREISRFASISAHGTGGKRLVIARLDAASPAAVHALLKTLEESPSNVFFILTSTLMPIDTLVSRAELYHFPTLTQNAVVEILTTVKRMQPGTAKLLAAKAGGQVNKALYSADVTDRKPTVLQVLKAFRELNAELLDRSALSWTDEHTELLAVWCREALSGRWRIFSAEESGISGRRIPMQILMALRQDIRPRLVVRSSLMTVLRGLT